MSPVAVTGAAGVRGAALGEALAALPEPVRARAQRAERVTQLALAAAGAALAQASRAAVDGPPRARLGVALGTAFGCFLTNATYQRRLAADGTRAASPRLFAATVSNAAAGEVGIGYRLGGPAITLSAGAAAGLFAIGHAADLVAAGRADAMVAGGMDACGPDLERWLADGGFTAGEAPVDEAAGVVVLERAEAPRRWASVLGHAEGFAPRGRGAGMTAVIGQALDDAGVDAGDLERVALDGAAVGEEAVWRALRAALGGLAAPPVRAATERANAFAAAGPLLLLAALADAPAGAPVLVVQACPSGHVAALVAARDAGST